GKDGGPVYLADIWPSQQEVEQTIQKSIDSDMFRKSYSEVFAGDERWRSLPVPNGETYAWDKGSTYIQRAPYFDDMALRPAAVEDIKGASVVGVLRDRVITGRVCTAASIN